MCVCKVAAEALGVWRNRTEESASVYVSSVSSEPRPEGCYWYSETKPDVMRDVVLSSSPTQMGNGAETSTEGKDRHPICASSGNVCSATCATT